MPGQSRSCSQYQVLVVWCCLLTVAWLFTTAYIIINLKQMKGGVTTSTRKPFSQTESSPSYIELMCQNSTFPFWEDNFTKCESCSFILQNNSIVCLRDSVTLLYAHVTFREHPVQNKTKSVVLFRNATLGKRKRKLVEGTYSPTMVGSVWVAKVVIMKQGDSISLNINGDFLTDNTFWGAYKLN